MVLLFCRCATSAGADKPCRHLISKLVEEACRFLILSTISFEFTAIKDSGRAHPSGTNPDWSRPKYRNHNKSLTIWSHYLPTEICALCYLHKDQGHNAECSYANIFFFLSFLFFIFFSHRLVTWLGYVAIHLSRLISFILWTHSPQGNEVFKRRGAHQIP
jgi:hypothetical protein